MKQIHDDNITGMFPKAFVTLKLKDHSEPITIVGSIDSIKATVKALIKDSTHDILDCITLPFWDENIQDIVMKNITIKEFLNASFSFDSQSTT